MKLDYEMFLFGAIAIVGLTDWLKGFDREDKLKKFYNLIPMIVAIPVAIVLTLKLGESWYMGFLYWAIEMAVSTIAYQNVIETIQNITKK